MSENTLSNKLIAFVSNNAWSVYNFRVDVIRKLIHMGASILVIAPSDNFTQLLEKEGCLFENINFDNRSENPIEDIGLYVHLKKIYRKHNPHLIFHYVAKPNIYGSMAAASLDIPSIAVVTGLGYAFDKKNWLALLMKLLYKRGLRKAKEVWFLNNEDARVFSNENIVNIQRIKVLPGEGVNTEYFSRTEPYQQEEGTEFKFLMACRLLKSKGIGIFADATRILKNKHFNIRCTLIGAMEKNHPDAISENDLLNWQQEGLIEYKGFYSDVRPFLNEAHSMVFPSFYHEGIPRCLMEAASMELPVITSLNTGCKEVVLNNVTGFLCNSKDPFDLAEKMERMIRQHSKSRIHMGRQGRKLVIRKFDVNSVIQEYIRTIFSYSASR
jgi:glycosyltransferase involved in cell wall biosynthesis